MPLQRSNTADKFIVDRRKRHRNSDVARAVRKTRDRLSQQAGNLDFDRELLKLHARAMTSGAVVIPLLVLAIAAAGRLAGVGNEIGLWALFTFETAGTLGEETIDAQRQAPKAILFSWLVAVVGGIIFIGFFVLSIPDVGTAMQSATPVQDIIDNALNALRNLEQDARLRQRHARLKKVAVERPHKPREETIEAANRCDSFVHSFQHRS